MEDREAAGPILVAVGPHGLSERMIDAVVRLAGCGERQRHPVTLVHVARVWGTGLGIQHPALYPSASERGAAHEVVTRAGQALREHGVQADALITASRDVAKAIARAALRADAHAIVVGRNPAGRVARLLRGADPARGLLNRAHLTCSVVVVATDRAP